MTKKTKRPSMKDVAELAGVSRTTVSFVINDRPDANIPQETKDKVWTAVTELGYRPNAIARGLRAQRTHTIGFISDVIATTPHAGHMIQGAQDFAWAHNNLLLLINTGGNQDMKTAAVNMLLERQVDGIIYATMYHREANPPATIKDVPAVLLDCYCQNKSMPSVVPDEVLGGYEATKTLLEKGHTRIGFINNIDDIPATNGRFEGYKKALTEFNIPFDSELIEFGGEPHGGYDAAKKLMQKTNRPTAIFCFNDYMAMSAYDAIRNLNLTIPDDVAVIGFDNQELIAPNLYPSLTTMELPHYEMGKWAMEKLLHLINNQEERGKTAVQHKMPCPLIQRKSI